MNRSGFEYYFDQAEVNKIIAFSQLCRHWKGTKAGERIILEDWQKFVLSQLYGWRLKDGHSKRKLKRFTTSYLDMARKNGKTTFESIKALYHLIIENEAGAQVWTGATKEAQAGIVINDAGKIAQKTPELRDKFKFTNHNGNIKRIIFQDKFMAPLGQDSNTHDGFDPSHGIIDEYHAHKSDAIYNVIESGMGSRENPTMNIITTAGFNKMYPCYSVLRKLAIDVLTGKVKNDRLFAAIFTLDDNDDWNDESLWIKSNPNLGSSVNIGYLRDRYLKAVQKGGTTEVDFKTKNLNLWTDASAVWITDDVWQRNTHGINVNDLIGMPCYAGLDLAKGVDINSFVLLFPDIKGKVCILPFFWIPESKLESKEADYERWAKAGHIRVTDGSMVDIDTILYDIMQIKDKYDIKMIAFDRWFAFNGIVQGLLKENVQMKELGQGFASMTHPTIEFENLANGFRFEHFNNPVLRWMMSNVELDRDAAGNPKPSKSKSMNKIDGIVAIIDAIGAWMGEYENNENVYNTIKLRSV